MIFIFILSLLSVSCYRTEYIEIEKPIHISVQELQLNHILELYDFASPIESYKVSSYFGFRRNPMGGEEFNLHGGIDLVGRKDAEIYSIYDGIVAEHYPPPNGYFKGHPTFGGMIVVYHGNGLYSVYAHLQKSFVKTGMEITKGQTIGIQGSTGKSTGDHLHFELRFDPLIVLRISQNQ